MGIRTYYNAAIGATYDRIDVTKLSRKKNLAPADKSYLTHLQASSGPSVHNPIKVIQNWFKAYHQNIARQKEIVALKAPFQKMSFIKKIIKHV